MSEDKLDLILTELSAIKAEAKRGSDSLKIIDRRLSLIEQRLSNIEPWISVDNSKLKFSAANGASGEGITA